MREQKDGASKNYATGACPVLGEIVLPVRCLVARVVIIAVRAASCVAVVVPVEAAAAVATTAVASSVGHDV
jgi:hypothetical protein